MITVAGDYCPLCGSELERVRVDGRDRRYCSECDRIVWRNSKPVASVVVIDRHGSGDGSRVGESAEGSEGGARVLLGRRDVDPDRGLWGVPGGNLEHDEATDVGVARELYEETGVRVDPADLRLFRVDHTPGEEQSVIGIRYVVQRDETEGVPDARDETSAVRFDTLDGFDADGGISPSDRSLLEAVLTE